MPTQVSQARTSGLFSLYHLRQIRDLAIDLVFPPTCVHCGRVDYYFCPGCLALLSSSPVQFSANSREQSLISIASTGIHEGILQSAVVALKYHKVFEVAPLLAKRITAVLDMLNLTIDIVLPVPLHTTRLQERGYNQAKEISTYVAQYTTLQHQPEALERTRNTRSQVGLQRMERLQNMEDAFIAKSDIVAGKTLLLIDDVLTTGATLAGCAAAALEAGALAVYGITVTSAQV